MNGVHFQMLVGLYGKIVDCEGGSVFTSQDGAYKLLYLETSIEEKFWCSRCKLLMLRAEEMRQKWDPKNVGRLPK